MSVIFSMTGFASVQGILPGQVGFTLTIKSVNHRFLDLNLRLPSQCDALEIQMRRVLKEQLRRGHVEVTLQMDRRVGGADAVECGVARRPMCRGTGRRRLCMV